MRTRFKSKTDQALFNKLRDELNTLYVDMKVLTNRITWRHRRLAAVDRRTACKVHGCRGEKGHGGCHVI